MPIRSMGSCLLVGCDKTNPSMLMAAASVDLPAVAVPGGPMLTGTFRGMPLGCGTDVWRLSEEVSAGTMSQEEFTQSESSMIRSAGHCNTMGTASTMSLVAEALGTIIPGVAGIPAPDSRLLEAAHRTGKLAVEMVGGRSQAEHDPHQSIISQRHCCPGRHRRLDKCCCPSSGHCRPSWHRSDYRRLRSDRVQGARCWSTCLPAGRFLMEDFHRAGGLLAVLARGPRSTRPICLTVTGRPLVDHLGRGSHLGYRGHPPPLRATGRRRGDCRLAGQSGSGRSDHQAGGGYTRAPAPPWAGRCVRQHRRLPGPDR